MPNVIPANVPVDIYITKTLDNVADLPDPVVAVLPVHDNWNDYGRNFCSPPYTRRGR